MKELNAEAHFYFWAKIEWELFFTTSGTSKQITFQKLFRILKDRGLTRKQLCEMTGLSQATITKVGNDLNINSSVLDKICLALECKVGDIVSFVPADTDEE